MFLFWGGGGGESCIFLISFACLYAKSVSSEFTSFFQVVNMLIVSCVQSFLHVYRTIQAWLIFLFLSHKNGLS